MTEEVTEVPSMGELLEGAPKNWGKWGPNDELGTLNYVKPADLIRAGSLVRKGKAFSLGLDFNQDGPQRTGWGGRFNPIHVMLATGTDAVAGRQDAGKLRYADDMVSMPLQCGTQWDALGHIFNGEKMWISNASVADIVTVVARTAENEFSMFLVDREEHGLQVREIEKLGLNGWPLCQVVFSDVVVPEENLLGGIGKG